MNTANPAWPKSRQTPRRPLEAPITATFENRNIRGWSTDIGAGGIGITIAAEVSVGAEVMVEFALDGSSSMKVRGVVRYRHGYKYGLEFLMIMPQDLEVIKKYVQADSSSQ